MHYVKGDSNLKRFIAVLCILTMGVGVLCGCMAESSETPTDTQEIAAE